MPRSPAYGGPKLPQAQGPAAVGPTFFDVTRHRYAGVVYSKTLAGPAYDATILADSPSYFWKLNESSGTSAADSADSNGGTYQGTVTLSQTGIGDGESAVLFDGSTGYVSTATNIASPGPQAPFSIECWFKTTSSSGGGLIIFNSAQTGSGASFDRMLYVGNDGKVRFGIYAGSAAVVAGSASTYNDGNWHHAVGVLASNNNLTLYVDGSSVGTNANTSAPVSYGGYWRLAEAADSSGSWPGLGGTQLYPFGGTQAKAAIYPVALSATQVSTHYNAASGSGPTLSFAGSAVKQTQIPQTASVSFAGGFGPTQTNKVLAGGVSFTGAITRAITRALSGGLSFTGAVAKQTARALTGALSFIGSVAKQTGRALTGSLSFAGAIPGRVITAVVSGGLSFTGAASRATSRGLAASLSFTGNLARSVSRALSGGLSFAGSVAKGISRALSGALSFAGSVTSSHVTIKLLTGALSFAGSVAKQTGKSLTGGLSFTGAITRQVAVPLAAGLSFIGATSRTVARALSGGLSFAGAITRGVGRVLSGGLSFAGAVTRRVAKSLSGGLAFTGTLTRGTTKTLAATLSFSGSVVRSISKAIAGALSFVGNLVRVLNPFVPKTQAFAFGGDVAATATLAFDQPVTFAFAGDEPVAFTIAGDL